VEAGSKDPVQGRNHDRRQARTAPGALAGAAAGRLDRGRPVHAAGSPAAHRADRRESGLREDDHVVGQVYELGEVTGTYALTGIHHGHLKLTVPFGIDIDIDLTAIDGL
jgi:hypothetical protein